MTTVPLRAAILPAVLASLKAQTRRADEIRIHAAHVEVHQSPFDPCVRYFLTPDRGPITKLSAVLDGDLKDDTIIVTVDDDVIYEPKWLACLIEAAEAYPDFAVGMSGWNLPFGGNIVRDPLHKCDVLEGWAGAAYRKRFFDDDVMSPPAYAKWVDDVWISSYLAKRNITRFVVRPPMATPTWEGNATGIHTWPDFAALNRRAADLCFGFVR